MPSEKEYWEEDPETTGKLSFCFTGDREAAVQLVIVSLLIPGKPEKGYKFKLLE